MLRAAHAAAGDRGAQPPFISGPLPAPPIADVALADLVGFFKDPVKGFFRALDYTLPWEVDGVTDAMPVDIDALEEWTVGDRMLADILRGMTPNEARDAEWRRGTLPPGNLGWRKATEIRDQVALLATDALNSRQVHPRAIDVDIDLGGGRRLAGTVTPVFGQRLVSVTYSKLDGRHLLEAWLPLLALYAHQPRTEWSALCIGRPKRGSTPRRETLGRPRHPRSICCVTWSRCTTPAAANRCRFRSRPPTRGPRPGTGDDPVHAAEYRWRTNRYPGEDQQPAHERAWGPRAPLATLMQPLRPGEECDGEDNRLGPTRPGCGCRCCAPKGAPSDAAFRPAGAAAGAPIDDGAGGQRRYRQDVRARRSGHPLSGRRPGHPGPDAARHVQPLGPQELRERVRSQIVQAVRAFDDRSVVGDNQVVQHLLTGTDEELEERKTRLRDALAAFDAATIATTHQFCNLVLKSLGVAGDSDAGVELVESLDDLVAEIVDDLYLAHFGRDRDDPQLPYPEALELAREVVNNPAAQLRPAEPDPDSRAAVCLRFVSDVVRELETRKRRRGILGYDDLLTRLADALDEPDAPARLRMHTRWPVVMVDEFQDTDPIQWKVIDRAFTGCSTLILIGDPKQAIYAFRGGDIVTYLEAAETAGEKRTLVTNWRSDAALVDRLQVVLEGAQLGDPRIVVHQVEARHRAAGWPGRRATTRSASEWSRGSRSGAEVFRPYRSTTCGSTSGSGRRHRGPARQRRHLRRTPNRGR